LVADCLLLSSVPTFFYLSSFLSLLFSLNHPFTTELFTLSLHDALPIFIILDVAVFHVGIGQNVKSIFGNAQSIPSIGDQFFLFSWQGVRALIGINSQVGRVILYSWFSWLNFRSLLIRDAHVYWLTKIRSGSTMVSK